MSHDSGGNELRWGVAVLAFEDRVDVIATSRGVPRHAAMSTARGRFPAEFEAAYGGGR